MLYNCRHISCDCHICAIILFKPIDNSLQTNHCNIEYHWFASTHRRDSSIKSLDLFPNWTKRINLFINYETTSHCIWAELYETNSKYIINVFIECMKNQKQIRQTFRNKSFQKTSHFHISRPHRALRPSHPSTSHLTTPSDAINVININILIILRDKAFPLLSRHLQTCIACTADPNRDPIVWSVLSFGLDFRSNAI